MAVYKRQVSKNKIANDRQATERKQKVKQGSRNKKRLISILHISISDYVACHMKSWLALIYISPLHNTLYVYVKHIWREFKVRKNTN